MKDFFGRYILGLPHNADGSLNRQFSRVRQYEEHFDFYARVVLFGAVCGALVAFATRPRVAREYIFESQPELVPTVTPLIETVNLDIGMAHSVTCDTPIGYIRCKGEELGYGNEVIKTMIRIAKAESGLRPEAKNPNSTASGVFQIIYGTWNSNHCEGSAFDYEDNIDCAYQIYAKRGFQPWASSASKWLAVN